MSVPHQSRTHLSAIAITDDHGSTRITLPAVTSTSVEVSVPRARIQDLWSLTLNGTDLDHHVWSGSVTFGSFAIDATDELVVRSLSRGEPNRPVEAYLWLPLPGSREVNAQRLDAPMVG